MATVCLVLGLATSILSLASIVVAIASSQWLRVRSPFFSNDVGLMRHCDVVNAYCGDMERLNSLVDAQYSGWFRSVQAMYLLHCVGALVSTVMYILYMIRFLEAKGSFKVVAAFNLGTLACGIYAVAVFGTKYTKFFGLSDLPVPDETSVFGAGFYMAIVGCCLTFLVMVFSAMEASRAADVLRNMQHRITVWSSPYTLFLEQDP